MRRLNVDVLNGVLPPVYFTGPCLLYRALFTLLSLVYFSAVRRSWTHMEPNSAGPLGLGVVQVSWSSTNHNTLDPVLPS